MGNGILCTIIETVAPVIEGVRFDAENLYENIKHKVSGQKNKSENDDENSD